MSAPGCRTDAANALHERTPSRRPRLLPLPVDLRRHPVVQRLVRPLGVVVREVPPQPAPQLRYVLVAPQVQVLVLDRPHG